jgi:hypothetical protein
MTFCVIDDLWWLPAAIASFSCYTMPPASAGGVFTSALEGGQSIPNLDRLVQIADALQVSPGELINAMVEDAGKRKDNHGFGK